MKKNINRSKFLLFYALTMIVRKFYLPLTSEISSKYALTKKAFSQNNINFKPVKWNHKPLLGKIWVCQPQITYQEL